MATVFDCATLPTWNTAQCCQGCHLATNEPLRYPRLRWPATGSPVSAAGVLATVAALAGTTKILCCRSQLHGYFALAGVPELHLDALDVTPA